MTPAGLAEALHREGRLAEAAATWGEVTAADPAGFEGWSGLGHAWASLKEYGLAIPALRRALALRPGEAWLRLALAQALFAIGHVSRAVAENQRALAEGDAPTGAMARRNLAIIAPGDPALDNAAILAIRQRWAAAEAAGVTPIHARPAPGEKLRLAYTGAFFGQPNWMKMYMGVINAHDRSRFEINLIVDGEMPNAGAGWQDHDNDRVWDVTGVPNAELAGHVAAAGIDVLVDLNGYSHAARLPLLLARAAPVQMAWNGMYGTTGLPGLDVLVGDPWVISPEEEAFCTEKVRRVTHTYLPFQVFYPTPEVAPPPCLARGHVTFGSLISAYKLTDMTLEVWAAVLRAVPGSRMLLRNRALDQVSNQQALVARLAALGVEAARLDLEGSGTHDEFLASYDRIDIALDGFPYNGGTTTAEALWQGVPVLTTIGDRWAGRTSRSILMAAGLSQDVAESPAALVAIARRMAASPEALAERRAAQRALLAASPACDPAALCRELEAIYLAAARPPSARQFSPT